MKPKILFINRSYWPDTEATGQLLTELCEGLADDFEVEVLAGKPNHIENDTHSEITGSEYRNSVRIDRVWHTTFNKSSMTGRLLNLITFTVSAFFSTLFRSRPALVITETDPFFLPLLGRWLKFRYRCRFVAYLQDVYPDVAIASGKVREGIATKFLRSLLVHCYNKADCVVVLSRDMLARCVRNGVIENKIRIIPNWIDCQRVQPIKSNNKFRQNHDLDQKFVVMYSGNLGVAHELQSIVVAAKCLQENSHIKFMFVGEGVQKRELQDYANLHSLKNIKFLSYQPRKQLSESLSAADIQIVSMKPGLQGCVEPSKVYGIMAAGTPILSICPDNSQVSELVREYDIGTVCSSDEADRLGEKLAEKILELSLDPSRLAEQGERARHLCLQKFDRSVQVSEFTRMITNVLAGDSISSRTVKPASREVVQPEASR